MMLGALRKLRLLLLLFGVAGLLLGKPTGAAGPRPRIYVYPEDPVITQHRDFEDVSTTFYGLDIVVYETLKNSSYVETDPEQADYFYLPVYLYWHTGSSIDAESIANYLRSKGPWFDRKQGADHIFAWPGDYGRCEWGFWGSLTKSIIIHHYGKVYPDREPRVNPCDPIKGWGDECDPLIGSFRRIMKDGMHGYNPCHFMGQDIVVPPTPWEHAHRTRYLNPQLELPRDGLVFFAGPVNLHHPGSHDHNPDAPWSDAWYSFGVRQSFTRMHRDTPGVRVFEKHIDNYFQQLSSTKFCLAAAGWGWGGRMKFAVTHGCIPVIVQDGVLVEWEEQVPMHEYAVRLPLWMMPKLVDTLEVLVRKGIADQMHKALDCTWRLHWWSAPHGRAFDLLMCELKARALGKKVKVDTKACTMECGDGVQLDLREQRQHI